MSNIKKAFKILKIRKTKDVSKIKAAYRKASHLHHPDKGGDAEKFLKVKEAYDLCMAYAEGRIYETNQPKSMIGMHVYITLQMVGNVVISSIFATHLVKVLAKKFGWNETTKQVAWVLIQGFSDIGLIITEDLLVSKIEEYLKDNQV